MPLSDFIEDEGQRLIILCFDYMTDRAFFMEMKKSEPGKHLSEAYCSISMGKAPAQFVDLDEFDAKSDAKAAKAAQIAEDDMDADFYGSEGYNDDEFSLDNFDEMSLDE